MRCEQCPVRMGLSCLGEGLGVQIENLRPLCRDVANGLPGRAEQLVRLAEGNPPPLGPSPDGRVRVGLLCPCLHMGGAEAWQLLLGRSTDPAKIDWVGCCVIDPRSVDPGMKAATECLMPVATGVAEAHKLAAKCDVLVLWAVSGIPNLVAGLARPPKVIAVSHSPLESPWGVAHNAAALGVDHWVAVSELALAAIPEPARAGATVIWNAVDDTRMVVHRSRAEMRRLWGVPEGAKVAGYLGRLSAEKDPHAMRRAIDHLPGDWHAVLVGSGAERVEPHPRLHLVGNDPAAGDVLNAFDVLVVPSHYESFGLTIAEGLRRGTPVVCPSVGIARIKPGMTHEIPVAADGPTLARAILEEGPIVAEWGSDTYPYDRERRVIAAREWVGEWLSVFLFGRAWTDLVVSLAPTPTRHPSQPTPGLDRQIRLAKLRRDCPHASKPPDCGCSGELDCSRLGKRVSRAECYACLEGKWGAE